VALWVDVSLFIQVTVVPTATVVGLGENAVVVSVRAPLTIEMVAVPPVGVGVWDGEDGLELLLLQAERPSDTRTSTPKHRDLIMELLSGTARATKLPSIGAQMGMKIRASLRTSFEELTGLSFAVRLGTDPLMSS
jgi:hypothetical protein